MDEPTLADPDKSLQRKVRRYSLILLIVALVLVSIEVVYALYQLTMFVL